MRNLKTYEDFIFEAMFDGKRVCMFVGRFQPFHNGHIAAMKRTSDLFQLPVVAVQILSKTDKSPFPEAFLKKMGSAVQKEFSSWMEAYFLYPQNLKTVIPQMVKYLRENGFESVGLGAGSDREKAYAPQIKYLNSDRSDVPVPEPFRLEMVDERSPGGPSGTKVREAIMAGDQKLFEELTPKSIHRYYEEMKKYLDK